MFELLVRFILRIGYYYALSLGVLNFEIDWRAGRAEIRRRTTIYCAVANLICICLLPWLSGTHVFNSLWSQSELLHEYLFTAILALRALCVCVTLVTRWLHRQRYIRLVNAFQQLIQKKPRVERMWRRGVISKFLSMLFADVMQIILNLRFVSNELTVRLVLGILIFYVLSALVNVIMCHYYFGLLNVYAHHILLNQELRLLLADIRLLECERRRGVFITKCCALADQLEALAKAQFQLQNLLERLNGFFGLQTLFMTTSHYMSSIAVIYFIYCEFVGSIRLNYAKLDIIFVCCDIVCYFMDIFISVNIINSVIDAHQEMWNMLSQSTIFSPCLDERLSVVLHSFQLQLACRPLKFSVLGLFNIEKSNAVFLTSSIITSSVVLIQHDMRNERIY